MNTAVVFYSLNGNTKYAAQKIADRLNADLIELKPKKAYHDKGFKKYFVGGKSAVFSESPELLPYEYNTDNYDIVLLGMPVWASCITPPLRTFIEENKGSLCNKEIGVFLCQSGAGAEKVFEKLKKLLGRASFKAELVLIDPKDRPKKDNEEKINNFCENFFKEKKDVK